MRWTTWGLPACFRFHFLQQLCDELRPKVRLQDQPPHRLPQIGSDSFSSPETYNLPGLLCPKTGVKRRKTLPSAVCAQPAFVHRGQAQLLIGSVDNAPLCWCPEDNRHPGTQTRVLVSKKRAEPDLPARISLENPFFAQRLCFYIVPIMMSNGAALSSLKDLKRFDGRNLISKSSYSMNG